MKFDPKNVLHNSHPRAEEMCLLDLVNLSLNANCTQNYLITGNSIFLCINNVFKHYILLKNTYFNLRYVIQILYEIK